jgi:hypothetical protein
MTPREEAEKQLISKAQKDPKFKESLIRDPRKTIAREFGIEVPRDVSIKVLEETAESVYIVIPAAPASIEGGELSDAELEAVAAGIGKTPPTTSPSPGPECIGTGFLSTCRIQETKIADTIKGSSPCCTV